MMTRYDIQQQQRDENQREQQFEPGTSEPSEPDDRASKRRCAKMHPIYRIVLFVYMIAHVSCSAKCFNTEKGMSIEGGDYRRLRNVALKSCAGECRDDFSCLAYEWTEPERTCILKSRSTTGPLIKKADTIIGFCIDEEDDVRDRFRDHVIVGPVIVSTDNVRGDECSEYCLNQPAALIYSWTPSMAIVDADGDGDEEESVPGTCTCMSALHELRLQFDSFSGFLPPKRLPRRAKFPSMVKRRRSYDSLTL